ncbi:MAG: FAD-dependent monooxygenase [Bacteroidota bacterium]
MNWVLPKTYSNPLFPYQRSLDQDAPSPVRHPVVIIGAGPTGLTAALDLASRGIRTVLITKENTVVVGSRAICFSKKTLEVMNRLQVVDKMLEKGVVWNIGKVFYDEDLVYEFNLLPEDGHKLPAFINLQQYYFEEYLVEAAMKHPLIDLRWEEEMVDLTQDEEKVSIHIQTPEGKYQLEAEYLLACDGVYSPTRKKCGIPYEGEAFAENFLIADITMEHDFPTERWFWFDPPFNRAYSALLHKQPDGVWRIDLQLGMDIDKEQELDPDRIKSRLRQMLGDEVGFELEWTSIYQFRCMRMETFVHDRIIFAGDSAHLVSPFGARGANSGVQDVDNVCWKLAYVLNNWAPKSLLNTYDEERSPAADENIFHSSNATDFISPKTEISLQFRNVALDLAASHDFARRLINSGRLSDPYRYRDSSLTSPDSDSWNCELGPGYAVSDVPVELRGKTVQLIDLLGNEFSLIHISQTVEVYQTTSILRYIVIPPDTSKAFEEKYDCREDSWYLIRPDHHIAARGRCFYDEHNRANFVLAFERVLGKGLDSPRKIFNEHLGKYLPDHKYKLLVDAHKGLTKKESERLNSKLILMLLEKVTFRELETTIRQVLS